MKKIFTLGLFAFVFVFVGASHALAATTVCGNPADSTSQITYISCSNGSPEAVQSAWGTNSSVPQVNGGAIVTDEGGFTSPCPTFILKCVDVTHTTYYRTQMLSIGHQLKASGFSGGIFGYWINQAQ